MENWAVSILILGAFFGFLLILSHLGIRQLIKGWKLDRRNKQFHGTRSGHITKPIYFQRSEIEPIYDLNSIKEWDDVGILSTIERSSDSEEFQNNSKTNT